MSARTGSGESGRAPLGRRSDQGRLLALFLAVCAPPSLLALSLLAERRDLSAIVAPTAAANAEVSYRTGVVLVLAGWFLLSLAGAWLASRRRPAASAAQQVDPMTAAPSASESKYLASAARKLKSPLNVLRLMADEVLERERTAAEYKKAIEGMSDEARKAGILVTNLLELSRIDAGSLELDEDVSLVRLAEEAVRDEKSRHPGANLVFRNEGDGTIKGNQQILARALSNLISNAVKYGGSAVEVEVFTGLENGFGLLGVDDNGPGIPPEEVDRLMGRFERGVDVAGRTGTGLGLPIAAGFIRAHGGEMKIGRSPRGGCRAVFRLPLAAVMSGGRS